MKNRMISLLLCAALALTLTACGARTAEPMPTEAPMAIPAVTAEPVAEPVLPAAETALPVVSVRRESESLCAAPDDDTLLLEYVCTEPSVVLRGNDAAAAAINEVLHRQYTDFAVGTASTGYDISGKEGFLREAADLYAQCVSSGYPESFFPYALRRETAVRRAGGNVLSLTYDDTTYCGGVHGYTGRSGCSFDLRTGRELTLRDLVTDYDAFLAAAVEQLRYISYAGEYAAYGLSEGYEDWLADLFRDGNWYLNDEGLVLMANPYEIASYAAGLIEFTLPYAWLGGRIYADYLPAGNSADGSLSGEIRDTADGAAYFYDDGTDGQGACIFFTASGTVEDVRLCAVTYLEYSTTYRTDSTLWCARRLTDGESVCVQTWVPDVMPNLAISWRDADGEHTALIAQSGMDGSLVLMNGEPFAERPVNISDKTVYHYDLNADYDPEEIVVTATDAGGVNEYTITVNGTALDKTSMPVGIRYDLWICDLHGDGVYELIFSADPGGDEYRTCGWRGDTLEPLRFTGDARYGADPNGLTTAVDGRIVFSGGVPILEAWYDQLGSYRATIGLTADHDGVVTMTPYVRWEYRGNGCYLTVAKILPVYLDESGVAVLTPGERLVLTGTNGQSTFFRTEDGRTGSLAPVYDGTGWTINGESEENFFEMLPYVG